MNLLKKAFRRACYAFCALTVLYSLIMLGISDISANMSVFTVLLFFPFSLLFTLSNAWILNKKWNFFAKSFARYCVLLVDIALFICLPQKENLTGAVGLILFVLTTVLYVAASLVISQIQSANQRKKDKKSNYQRVYPEVNGK